MQLLNDIERKKKTQNNIRVVATCYNLVYSMLSILYLAIVVVDCRHRNVKRNNLFSSLQNVMDVSNICSLPIKH